MKKLVLAAAVLTLFAGESYAQSSVTLYGIVDTALIYGNNMATGKPGQGSSGVEMDSGGTHASRWGLEGTEDLGGGTAAIFRLEDGFSNANGKLSNTGVLFGREAYVGLKSQTDGTLTLGRQYDFMSQWLSALSAEGEGWAGNLGSHPYNNDDMIRHTSTENSARYVSPAYRGFQVGTMYGFSNDAGQFANNRAIAAAARYNNGPVSLVASYVEFDRSAGAANFNANGAVTNSDGDATITGGRQQVWGLGAHYQFDRGVLGFVWTHSATDDVTSVWQGGNLVPLIGDSLRFNNFEINGRYFITHAFAVSAAYTYTDGAFDSSGEDLSPKWHEGILRADYALSTRTDLYAESLYQTVSGGGGNVVFNASMFNVTPSADNKQLLLVVGITHSF